MNIKTSQALYTGESFIDDLMDYMEENGRQYGFFETDYYRKYMKTDF